MATSSIFHDVVIVTEQDAQRFVEALEEAEKKSHEKGKPGDADWSTFPQLFKCSGLQFHTV